MSQKKDKNKKKASKKERKDTGFKNKIIKYNTNYPDDSNAQE